jgi:hypothetical protein
MRRILAGLLSLSAASCGLENFFSNQTHEDTAKPTSALTGSATWAGAANAQYFAVDGDFNRIEPLTTTRCNTSNLPQTSWPNSCFLTSYDAASSTYQMDLPSSKYTWIIAQARSGNMLLSNIVPQIGQETVLHGVDLNARTTTETLIVVARLAADGLKFKQLTPSVYLGTRASIQAAMDTPGPTQDLLHMVERLMAAFDKDLAGGDPAFFQFPQYDSAYALKQSAIASGYLGRHPVDYTGSGIQQTDSSLFDAQLAVVAKASPSPAGCPDPTMIRVVFTVDFNDGTLNGNCGSIDRFKWAKDKPGKSMFFVGWVHLQSEVQDPAINNLLGASTPNTIPMYDDGTNGDEVAGDNIWSVAFDIPRTPGKLLRIGYKYTWGTFGAQWSGSEEWPGNSRILEVVDDNGDNIVWRRDVFGDEATNKDNSNLNLSGTGSITWTTDLHGCGTPESHENKYDNTAAAGARNTCKCLPVPTPKSVGPINRSCSSP